MSIFIVSMMSTMARRHELSDEQWNAIKGLVPVKKSDPGRTGRNNRLFINAVLFVLKTGIPWDYLPDRSGKPNTVWKRYDRWCSRGVWERLFQAMGEPELEEVQIDSTGIKSHPVASTGRRLADEKKKTLTNEAASTVLVEGCERCINGRLFVLIILGLFLGIFDAEVDGGSISEW